MTLDTSPKTYGEPSIEALASGLGTLGRYGDNYMVHAAEGETIVPREVLEQNPGLKEDLFRQMTMMGIENPNRYVVGDQLNSINPITGQPEFFFKKIFRAIKKVVKKAAPIIVPMLGNMILPGIGGLIASGLYTKAQGGSWGDALKAAGMAYLGNVASAGIMGGINAPSGEFFDGFSTGIGQGIRAPFDAVRGLIQGGSASPFQQGIFASDPAGAAAPGISLKDKIIRQYNPQYLEGAEPSSVLPTSSKAAVKAVPSVESVKAPSFKPIVLQKAANVPPVSSKSTFLDTLKKQNLYKGSLAESLKLKYPNLSDGAIANVVQGKGPLGSPFTAMPGYGSEGLTTDVGSDFFGPKIPSEVTLSPNYDGRALFAATADDVLNIDKYGSIIPDGQIEGLTRGEKLSMLERGYKRFMPDFLGGENTVEIIGADGKGTGRFLKGDQARQYVKTMAGDAEIDNVLNTLGEKQGTKFLDSAEGQKRLLAVADKASKSFGRTTMEKAVGPGIIALSGAYAGGAFKEPPPPPPNASEKEMAAYRAYLAEYAANPDMSDDRHRVLRTASGIIPNYTRSQVASIIGRDVSGMPGYRFAAAGGGEVMGPGTGTSDSIPARLSDGEFVMTARAVRNAGGGDRSLGAARMYDMMNRFEQGAA